MNPKKASTEEAIIFVLSEKWPLSAKEIYNLIIKRCDKDISYQAVHKKLTELEAMNVILKEGKTYQLHKLWISNQRRFIDRIENVYSNSQKKYTLDPNFEGSIEWRFDDYSNVVITIADLLAKQVFIGSTPSGPLGITRHVWWPLNFKFGDMLILRSVIKKNPLSYMVTRYNFPFDKWASKEFLKNGWGGVKLGVNFDEFDNEIIVHGDSILVFEYSEESKKVIDQFYQKNSNLTDLFSEFTRKKFASRKVDIMVKITKNQQMAEVLRKKFMTYFK
ncbi:MAG: hypothetical protein V1672_00400 [Candidatus Diapherotrites archaeon]